MRTREGQYDAFVTEVQNRLAREFPDLHAQLWRFQQLVAEYKWDILQQDSPPFLRVDIRSDDLSFIFWINVGMQTGYDYDEREMDRLVYHIGEAGRDGLANVAAGQPPSAWPPFRSVVE